MEETIYVVGESRTGMDNAITIMYNSFYIAFEIEPKTGIIVDVGCTHTIDITEDFIKKIFLRKDIRKSSQIEDEVKRRYHGTSQRAVIVSYKDALKRYLDIKNKFNL